MKAFVFRGAGQFGIEERPIPIVHRGEVLIRTQLVTIGATDVQIVRGEYPVEPGIILGHEAVGSIHELGPAVTAYKAGQRVLLGAMRHCGHCDACLVGRPAQCESPLGDWRFGTVIDGVQAEYFRVPYPEPSLVLVPNALSDEEVLLLSDTASAGFAAAENARIRLGDNVAVFGQGPVGLCATLGAGLTGAADVYAIDGDPRRLDVATQFGATVTLLRHEDPVRNIMEMTGGRGLDACIETLGDQKTYDDCMSVLRSGGRLSSLPTYSGGRLSVPLETVHPGLSENMVVTASSPGGRARLKRLMHLIQSGRINLQPLLTHRFPFAEIEKAYALCQSREQGVLKVAIQMH